MISLSLFIAILLIVNITIFINHSSLVKLGIPLDNPDKKRKLHSKPILISGGFIVIVNLILVSIFSFQSKDDYLILILKNDFHLYIFLFTIIVAYIIGLYDDKFEINPLLKLFYLGLIILSILFTNEIFILNEIKFSFTERILYLRNFSIPITLLCILLFINSINMFDGINLQSSTFIFIFLIYFLSENIMSSFVILMTIPFILFFYLNYLNKSFLGDSGCFVISILIGLLSISFYNLGFIKYSDNIFLLMLIPGIDMFRLFILRLKNKKNPFSPDRNHIHHLLQNNLGYKKAMLTIITYNYSVILLLKLSVNNVFILIYILLTYTFIIYRNLPKQKI